MISKENVNQTKASNENDSKNMTPESEMDFQMVASKEKEAYLKKRMEELEELEKKIREKEKQQKELESKKKQILLRIAPSLWNDLAQWAEEDFRSINGQIEYLLSESVKKHRNK